MNKETYQLEAFESLLTFEFISEGPKGSIKKRVQYQKTKWRNIYNLAFGDINTEFKDFDDFAISNNNDTDKILATVASTIFAFMDKYPNAIIYAKGSTESRTRLYRIGISKNLQELVEDFEIYGLLDDIGWVEYKKNQSYSAFYIKKR